MNQKNKKNISCDNNNLKNAVSNYFKSHPNSVVIEKTDFDNLVKIENNEDLALLAIAKATAALATHVVVSNYQVGACVLGVSGKVYLGTNFEFSNTPLIYTIHGEQCAIHNAAVNGEKKITKLAVNESPCGQCRQYMVELGHSKEFQIIFCSADENGYITKESLEKLIPKNFGPENLGLTGTMLNSDEWSITNTPPTPNKQTQIALDMAKISYCPYSNRPFGVALVFSSPTGDIIIPGKTLENAAYNPSISATRGAFSLASMLGINVATLKEVVAVESKCCSVTQHPAERKNEALTIIQSILPSIQPSTIFTYIPIDVTPPSPPKNVSYTMKNGKHILRLPL